MTLGCRLHSGSEDVKDEAGRIGAMVPPNGISPQSNSTLKEVLG